jgi:hypothetical protein
MMSMLFLCRSELSHSLASLVDCSVIAVSRLRSHPMFSSLNYWYLVAERGVRSSYHLGFQFTHVNLRQSPSITSHQYHRELNAPVESMTGLKITCPLPVVQCTQLRNGLSIMRTFDCMVTSEHTTGQTHDIVCT